MTWHRLCSPLHPIDAAKGAPERDGLSTSMRFAAGSAARRVCVGTQEETNGMIFGVGYRF
jgi:hypothetical protein